MSVELEAKQPTPSEEKISLFPSNLESTGGAASTSIPTDQSGQNAESSAPKAATHRAKSDKTEKRRVRTLLARSFYAIGSVLGFSMVSRSFRGKSKKRSEQKEGGGDSEWADIVDDVVESDNESASIDNYIEFLRHRDARRPGHVTHGGKFVRFAKRRMGQQSENGFDKENKAKDDAPNDDSTDSEPSIPWFGSNFGSDQ